MENMPDQNQQSTPPPEKQAEIPSQGQTPPTQPPMPAPPESIATPLDKLKPYIEQMTPWLILLIVIIVGIFAFSRLRGGIVSTQTGVVPTSSPTATPTPTPIRAFSIIATQSAFLEYEQAISTLSGELDIFSVQDPALSPPEINLPLGFSDL